MGLSKAKIDFKDTTRKLLPISKRGATWLDWNYTAISPIMELNSQFQELNLNLIFNNSYSIQSKAMQPLLNDLFDPNLRGISLTTNNSNVDFIGFTVNWPDYLAHGNYDTILDGFLRRYLYMGVQYDIDVVVTGVTTEADTYLTNLDAALVGNEILTDEEIWAVIYMWNQFYGASLLSDFASLHLVSKTSKLNALKDFFIGQVLIEEINGGAGIGWDKNGFSSDDDLSYLRNGTNMSALITDEDNHCSVVQVSRAGTKDSQIPYGVEAGTNHDFIKTNHVALTMDSQKGLDSDGGIQPTISDVSKFEDIFMSYVDGGLGNLMIGEENAGTAYAVSAGYVLPTLNKFICAHNDDSVVGNWSDAKVCTLAEVDSGLGESNRIFVNRVLKEYNRRIGR
jgi:hypothetical protein